MAARQFGLVVFRALAVYILYASISRLYQISYVFIGLEGFPTEVGYPLSQKIASVSIWSVQVLLAAFLWTNAEKFVGDEGGEKLTVRGGNWVVRLVFTSLGILICVFSINSIIELIANFLVPDPIWKDRDREAVLAMITELVQFLLGLGLFLAFRFDKRAALAAAQAVEEPEP